MDLISAFYQIIGSIICHQLPERSLSINGTILPLCARDTGIYAGFTISFLYLKLAGRLDADKPPRSLMSFMLCMLMLPMLYDGISSYIGLRSTTNPIRLITGLLFGMCLPVLLIPAANFKVHEKNNRDVIRKYSEIVILAAVNIAFGVVVLKTAIIPWILPASFSVFGFIFFIARIVYTFVVRLAGRRAKHSRLLTAGVTLLVLCLMYMFSSLIFQPIKNLLLKA